MRGRHMHEDSRWRRRKFRFRRRSDTSEMVRHLIFPRPFVFATSGNSFESTMVRATRTVSPFVPITHYPKTRFERFRNCFEAVKLEVLFP